MVRRYAFLVGLVAFFYSHVGFAQVQLDDAKQTILDRLTTLSNPADTRWILGQNVGHGNEELFSPYRRYIERIELNHGKRPAMLGLDLGYDSIPRSQNAAIRLATDHWASGGMLTCSMHPGSPIDGGDVHSLSTPHHFRKLFVSGSRAQVRWAADQRRIGDFLEELQRQGIVVLWRPFHEMNGGWFWWCPRNGDTWLPRNDYVRLWRELHDYLTRERGLKNLIWVYSAAAQTDSGQRPADYYYPGDAFVDVVGLDYYSDSMTSLDQFGSYTAMEALGKPMGLCEVGPETQRDGSFDCRRVASVMERHPRMSYAMFWHSWTGADVAMVDCANLRALTGDTNVIWVLGQRKRRPR